MPDFPGPADPSALGMPDPAEVQATPPQAGRLPGCVRPDHWRIDLLLALPVEKLERLALEARLRRSAIRPGKHR